MKKKYLYSLLSTYLFAAVGASLSSCNELNASANTAQPKKKQINKVCIYKKPELKLRIDTLNVSDDNLKKITTQGAAGVFFPGTNTVLVYHFNPASDSAYIQRYCEHNNNLRALVTRHELEHARKSDLTHNTEFFSAVGRARVAAINEIMAPASEIIEAVDYHARTGKTYPDAKSFIVQADSAIIQAMGPFMPGYVNYNYRPVADAVITYALKSFLNSVERGYYIHTVRKAYNNRPALNKPTSNLMNTFLFNPDHNLWDPIWEFQSTAGSCNPYKTASWTVRQELMQKVDSVIYSCTDADIFTSFLQNGFSR